MMRYVAISGNHGLSVLDGTEVVDIDRELGSGLAVRGETIYRMACRRRESGAVILTYDAAGTLARDRIDDVSDPHDLLAYGTGELLCVSSFDNRIVGIRADRSTYDRFRVDAPFDAWHLNCVQMHAGRLYATAFGRFDTFRGWRGRELDHPGILFDVDSGEDVMTGLSQPHSPRFFAGAWTVCNSASQTIVRDENGRRKTLDLGGFTRGMCMHEGVLYVGVSAHLVPERRTANSMIALVDLAQWRLIRTVALPDTRGIYDLTVIDETHLARLRASVTSQPRAAESLDAPAAAADASAIVVGITATLPERLRLHDAVQPTFRVENRGRSVIAAQTVLTYRWFDAGGAPRGLGTWYQTPLELPLHPGEAMEIPAIITAPPRIGRYTLRVTLMEHGSAWFDDLDPANGLSGEVEIVS